MMICADSNSHDPDAEQCVLGCLILDPSACLQIAQLLKADDFHIDSNRRLFTHVLSLFGDTGRIDASALIDRLRESDELEVIGGMSYLAKTLHSVSIACHVEQHAEIVAQHARRRKLI